MAGFCCCCFYDCLLPSISAWFKYPVQVTLPVTEYSLSYLSQAAGLVHRHSCYCLSIVLIWVPHHQLSDLLFCLHWSLLGWSMPLWSTSSSLPYALLSVADFILQFCCWAGGLPHVFLKTLNASLVCGASTFLAKMATCSPSCYFQISVCSSQKRLSLLMFVFPRGQYPKRVAGSDTQGEVVPSIFPQFLLLRVQASMVLLLMILSGELLVLFHFTYLAIWVSLPKADGERC